jgi:PPOX class probable F420-dependent enzyme
VPSRRDQIRMTEQEMADFLDEQRTMNVATLDPQGRIHLVAMWYAQLDGSWAFWTYGRSQKVLNLRRDPRLTALVESGEKYEELRGVELVGKGRIVEDRERVMAFGRAVFERYTGPYTDEVAPVLESMGAKRVLVELDVESVVSWDHRKLGGRY